MSMSQLHRSIRLPPLPTIRDIVRIYKLRAIKQLSQNFLMDERLTDKIVKAAGKIQGGQVCEVGPGPGGITRSILKRDVDQLIVVEKDKRFLPSLEFLSEASHDRMKIIMGDVMSFNMEKIFPEDQRVSWESPPPNIHIIGNLPFNVSTPLIIKWIRAISERNNAWSYGRVKLTLTFQKEVAERMVAQASEDQRCRLSVMCQNWCDVDHKFTIPGSAFVPKPDVDVGVVHFTPLVEPVIPLPFSIVEKVVKTIFGYRQKYSLKGASNLFPPVIRDKLALEMYALADLKAVIRPYQLTVEEFGRLCKAYCEICDKNPKLYKYEYRAPLMDDENYDEEEDFVCDPETTSGKCL